MGNAGALALEGPHSVPHKIVQNSGSEPEGGREDIPHVAELSEEIEQSQMDQSSGAPYQAEFYKLGRHSFQHLMETILLLKYVLSADGEVHCQNKEPFYLVQAAMTARGKFSTIVWYASQGVQHPGHL